MKNIALTIVPKRGWNANYFSRVWERYIGTVGFNKLVDGKTLVMPYSLYQTVNANIKVPHSPFPLSSPQCFGYIGTTDPAIIVGDMGFVSHYVGSVDEFHVIEYNSIGVFKRIFEFFKGIRVKSERICYSSFGMYTYRVLNKGY